MLKLLLMIAVLASPPGSGSAGAGRRRATGRQAEHQACTDAAPQTMLACVHCGVHLPKADALFDVGGKPYCSEAHRLQGPR
jgi:uncharacterized protein